MKARSFETSVNVYQSNSYDNIEDLNLLQYRQKKLNSRSDYTVFWYVTPCSLKFTEFFLFEEPTAFTMKTGTEGTRETSYIIKTDHQFLKEEMWENALLWSVVF